MARMLPADLRRAEAEAVEAIAAALASQAKGFWTAEFRFEGLRILPVSLRLLAALLPAHAEARLVFPDAGAAALAKRDAAEQAGSITELSGIKRLQQADGGSDGLLVLVAPTPADYEDVEAVCAQHRGVLQFPVQQNNTAAVGIGTVARERRKGFLATWQSAYALIPTGEGALRRAYPLDWQLYRRDPDGYRFVKDFELKPDAEQMADALEGEGGGVARGLKAVDRLIEGLQN